MSEVKSTAEACYEARIALIKERDELARQVSELQLSQKKIINAFGISGEGAHSKLVIEYVHGLVAENVALKAAIPKPKEIDFHDDRLDDVSVAEQVGFNHAISTIRTSMQETPATDAFTAELRAQGVDEFTTKLGAKAAILSTSSNVYKVLKSIIFSGVEFAANLRAGRKCSIPPAGWICTRAAGHNGPCAAVEDASHE